MACKILSCKSPLCFHKNMHAANLLIVSLLPGNLIKLSNGFSLVSRFEITPTISLSGTVNCIQSDSSLPQLFYELT